MGATRPAVFRFLPADRMDEARALSRQPHLSEVGADVERLIDSLPEAPARYERAAHYLAAILVEISDEMGLELPYEDVADGLGMHHRYEFHFLERTAECRDTLQRVRLDEGLLAEFSGEAEALHALTDALEALRANFAAIPPGHMLLVGA